MTASDRITTPVASRDECYPAPSDPELARWAYALAPDGEATSKVLLATKILRDKCKELGLPSSLSILVPAIRWAEQDAQAAARYTPSKPGDSAVLDTYAREMHAAGMPLDRAREVALRLYIAGFSAGVGEYITEPEVER